MPAARHTEAKTIDDKIKVAFSNVDQKLKSDDVKPIATTSYIVRNYNEQIEAMRAKGATYAMICAELRKTLKEDITPESLTNVMSKWRNKQKRLQERTGQPAAAASNH